MRNFFRIVSPLLAAIFSWGCANHDSGSRIIAIDWDAAPIPEPEICRVVPLETSQESLVGNRFDVRIFDDKIFILEYGKVGIYGMDGSLINVINKFGRGPQEYLMATAMDYCNDTLYIVDGMEHKILKDDLQGNYLGVTPCENFLGQFVLWADRYVAITDGYRDSQCALSAFLPDGRLERGFMPSIEGNMGSWNYDLFRCGDKLLFRQDNTRTIWEIDRAMNITTHVEFDFGSQWMTPEEIVSQFGEDPDPYKAKAYTDRQEKTSSFAFIESETAMHLNFSLGKQYYGWLYDKKTQTQYLSKFDTENRQLSTEHIYSFYRDCLVTVIPASRYLEHYADLHPLQIAEDDNPVLVFYKPAH